MLVHDISPVIASLGPVSIRWYSLAYVIGFLLGYWWLHRLAKRGHVKNLTSEKVDALTTWLILGVILGGRLFEFVFYQPHVWSQDPLEVLRIWHGGMSFHGGLIGAALVSFLYCRKHKIPLLQVGDALAMPAAIALFLGRIANYINAELVGTVTDVSWCVKFPGYEQCRHPSQLYEALKNLIITTGLAVMYPRKGKLKDGTLLWGFVAAYGLLRPIATIWRDDPDVLWIFSMGQVLSLIMLVIGVAALIQLYRPYLHKIFPRRGT